MTGNWEWRAIGADALRTGLLVFRTFSFIIALVCFTLPRVCVASPDETPPERAILTLEVNGVDHSDVLALVIKNDVLVKRSDLEVAGLSSFSGKEKTISGARYVSLASLAPGITYKFDEKNLIISLMAEPTYLGLRKLNLSFAEPPDLEYRSDLTGFLNYSFNFTDFASWDGFFEGGISWHRFLLYSGLSRGLQGLVRGLTNLTYDDPRNMRRWMLGDTFVNTGVLGGGAFLGGFSIAKNFGLDPYFIRFPTQTISGALTVPATVDVYRNGLLIKQEQLPPGQFTLNNLPGLSGLTNTQVVIRDAFGNTRAINQQFYTATGLLEQGLNDYSYGIGMVRSSVGTANWNYGPLALSAIHRFGLTNWVTPGYRLEVERDLLSGGPQIAFGFPIGETDFAASASRSRGQSGAAASFVYQYLIPGGFAMGAAAQWMSPHYANLSIKPSDNRPLFESDATISRDIGPSTSLSFEYRYQNLRDRLLTTGTDHSVLASALVRISERLSFIASITHTLPGNRQPANDVFFGLNYLLGKTTVASASYDHRYNGDFGAVSVQKPLANGPGYGYLVQAQEGATEQEAGQFQYQNDWGTYEADYTRLQGNDSSTLRIAGGVVAIGGRVLPTRPVQNGFALLRVPGVSKVDCEWSNQVEGRTDAKGDCLIPNLLPYYGNQLGINQNNIPLEYSVGQVSKIVAVPYRGGAVLTFPVHKIQQLTGKLIVREGATAVIPADGEFIVQAGGERLSSPIGEKGEFYFEDVAPGTYDAAIEFADGTCKLPLQVPQSGKFVVKLGTLGCAMKGVSK